MKLMYTLSEESVAHEWTGREPAAHDPADDEAAEDAARGWPPGSAIESSCDADEPPPLGGAFDPRLSFRAAKQRAMAHWERWYLTQLLRYTRGNLSEAARIAHSDRGHLRKLARKHLSFGDPPQ
jgi:DNA-binding NtrC family response regulator